MDEFSITRPEPATPARDNARHELPRGDVKKRRSPRETPEPQIPEPPEAPGEEDTSHQVDELA
jgi:hypothetical protein